jgi:hypothetical protein
VPLLPPGLNFKMPDLALGGDGFYTASNDITFAPAAKDYIATVMVEVTPFGEWSYWAFADVLVKRIPQPPAAFIVTPTSGLVTTRDGGTDHFTVACVYGRWRND